MRLRPHCPSAVLVAALLALVLVVGQPLAAGAGVDWNKVGYRRTVGTCPSDGVHVNPTGRIWMAEYGKAGVVRHRATFKLYRTEVSAGFNFARLRRTYSTGRFPNDHRSFMGQVPSSGWHRFTNVQGTTSYRMDVTATWDRAYRRDWSTTQPIVWCAAQG